MWAHCAASPLHPLIPLSPQAKHHACQRFVLFSKAYSLLTEDQFIVPAAAYAKS